MIQPESDIPLGLDDSIFNDAMLDEIATRGQDKDMSTIVDDTPRPVYKDVPLHPTVESTPGWTVTHPPTEMTKRYDALATKQNVDRFIQSRLTKLPEGGYGIHLKEGVVPMGQFMATSRFHKLWDETTEENRVSNTDPMLEVLERYLPEARRTPEGSPVLFNETSFEAPVADTDTDYEVDPSKPGAAIDMQRVAYAFGEIVRGISEANQASHLRADPSTAVRKHGREAGNIVKGKSVNAGKLLHANEQHIETLVGARELKEAGFSNQRIEQIRTEVNRIIANKFDRTGPDVVQMRNIKRDNLNKIAYPKN